MATASRVKIKNAGTQRRTTTKNEAYAKKTRAVTRHETFDTDLDRWTSRLHPTGLRIGLKKLSTTNLTIEEGAFEGSSLHRDDFRLDGDFFDCKTSTSSTTADARHRNICPKETTSSTNISPLLSFYDQLQTLRQNSNLSHVFELRPDLANVGGSSDFVESNCSASSTASFAQRKLSPRRQHLRQPN